MHKHITLWIIIIIVPIIIISTVWHTNNMLDMSIKHNIKNMQTVDLLLGKEYKSEFSRLDSFSDIKNKSMDFTKRYNSENLEVKFSYKGSYFDSKPVEEYIRELNIGTRAAMLYTKGEYPQYIIATPISSVHSMYSIFDMSELYNQKKHMYCFGILFAILISLLISIITYMISKKIAKPLEDLTIAAKAISKGETAEIDLAKCKYEAKDLGKAFINMQNAITNREQDLQVELAKKQYLLNAISHEMRTPLTSILGNARILQGAELDANTRNELAEKICSQAERLSNMESQLMMLVSNKDEIELAKVNIKNILERVAEEAKSASNVNIIVEGESSVIRANEDLMKILINNILDNAIHVSKANDTIIMRTEKHGFSIRDNGIGMDDEEIASAFEPFYKSDKARTRKHGGAGLGLAICKRIAELHDAKLSINSEKGKGTTVRYEQ